MSSEVGPLHADLSFLIGDTWAAPEVWAVCLDDAAIDLTEGWVVTAQARARADSPVVLAEWSTANGRVLLGTAAVDISPGVSVTTSTIQLRHSAATSQAWAPFAARFDCQIQRGPDDDPQRYTIAAGTVRAIRDVTRPTP